MKLKSLYDLYIHELQDLHSAESQVRTSLPEMIKYVHSTDLKTVLKNYLETTRDQIDRLNQILKNHGEKREQDRSDGMEGLLAQCENMLDMEAEETILDLGIIATLQRAVHYEISGYGTVRAFAERLGEEEDAALLAETLEEESSADDELTGVATLLQSQCMEDEGESEDEESLRPKSHRIRLMEAIGKR